MKVVKLEEIEPRTVGKDGLLWKPLRHTLGVEAFGINAYTAAKAGDEVVEHHDETGLEHEEVYVVISGRATFHIGDEEVDAPAGTVVFLDDPAEKRGAVAAEGGTTVLAIGGKRGEAYRVSPWEYSFRATTESRAGRYDEALAIMSEGFARYPDDPGLLYNAACFESLAGDTETAIEHLRRSVELDPQFREYADDDPDLERIRKDPRFPGGLGETPG